MTDISLDEAWNVLRDDDQAVLIDVRTAAEWTFVGVPDLSSIGRELRTVEWSRFPGGAPNPNFLTEATNGIDPSRPVLLLCRSGARSAAATAALTNNGFTAARNVVAGFEGDLDATGHRHGGWKDQLPWRQS